MLAPHASEATETDFFVKVLRKPLTLRPNRYMLTNVRERNPLARQL